MRHPPTGKRERDLATFVLKALSAFDGIAQGVLGGAELDAIGARQMSRELAVEATDVLERWGLGIETDGHPDPFHQARDSWHEGGLHVTHEDHQERLMAAAKNLLDTRTPIPDQASDYVTRDAIRQLQAAVKAIEARR